MRTTVELDEDTTAAVAELRRQGRGASDAVNELIRRGMRAVEEPPEFVPITRPLGIKIDISNVSDAIDLLEGPDAR